MRRITLTIVSTIAILVLLFAYKTSRNESVGTAAVTAADGTGGGAHIVSAPTSSGSASSAGAGSDAITVPGTDSPTDATTTSSSDTTATSSKRSSTARDTASTTSRSSTSSTSTTSLAPSTPSTSSTTTTSSAPVVVDGAAIDTRYGPVQVEVTITKGKITSVTVPVYPQDSGRDQEINSQAIPILQQEVLAAQGAQIDAVSGATYTSDGFVSSLQSALDAAHFGQ